MLSPSTRGVLVTLASLLALGCGGEVDDDPKPDAPPPVAHATLVDECWIDLAENVVCSHKAAVHAPYRDAAVAKLGHGINALFNDGATGRFGAVDGNGVFRCLGSDWDAQNAAVVVKSSNESPLVAVACGWAYTCGLRADGGASCQGDMSLGVGAPMVPGVDASGEVIAFGGKKALDLKAGSSQACGLLDDGTVVCWGASADFGLGVEGKSVPVAVPDIPPDIVQIGVGEGLSCARSQEGEVFCWGAWFPMQHRPGKPTRVSGLPQVVDLVVGNHTVCARDRFDAVWCWGDNESGEAGPPPSFGTAGNTPVEPRVVSGIVGEVVELAAGKDASYARTSDGVIWAWGSVWPYGKLAPIGTTSD